MKFTKKQWIITGVIIIVILGVAFFVGGSPKTENVQEPVATAMPTVQPSPEQTDNAQETAQPTQTPKMTDEPTQTSTPVVQEVAPEKTPEAEKTPMPQVDAVTPKQQNQSNEAVKNTCTISISCKTILNNMDKFNKDKKSILPSDGVILSQTTVEFKEGETVFQILRRETKRNKIHMEFSASPVYQTNYVEGIANIYEFDCGELSGWTFRVNGGYPQHGSSMYTVQKGDIIEWLYTCDLGRDVGNVYTNGGN